MQPVLFEIPFLGWPIYGYGLMLGISFVVGYYLAGFLARWYGLDESKIYTGLAIGIAMSVVGARLFHILSNPDLHWTIPKMLNVKEGGLVAYGGYIVGVGSGILYYRWKKLPALAYLDCVAPTLALGLGFTRIGCFLRGCCYGVRTDSPLGMSFPPGSLAAQQHAARGWEMMANGYSVPVYPTQLFESGVGFLLFGVTLWLFAKKRKEERSIIAAMKANESPPKRKLYDGTILMAFILLYSIWRFFVEFIRDDGGRGEIGPLSTSQFIGILLIPLALWLYFKLLPKLQKAPSGFEKKGSRAEQRRSGKKTKKKKGK